MAERADERLVRLLGIVAFLDAAGAVTVDDLATRFGVTPQQVLEDVDALWVSGTPGYWPDDLIDFDAASLERGVVRLTEARGMTRPLRLGTREAVALLAALRAMRATVAVSGDVSARALDAVLAKLTDATGEAAAAVDVELTLDGAPQVLATVRDALARGRRLRIRYVTASDVATQREVDPLRLVTQDEHTYLLAWCYRAQDQRTFRLDRVLEAEVVDVPVATHRAVRDVVDFVPDPSGELVRLVLDAPARRVAEEVPVDSVRNLDDGTFEVVLRVADTVWLRHLLLQVAGHVRHVEPAWAAVDAAESARAALAAYARLTPDADPASGGAGA
ncbi:helix-turn-helix transcriptional regulator [Luteimicrobium subarcticum]|uniref:Proteasome accessory factor C n=1 Tax=Luteimicrobium subarcticum TaxID=620910 RepID=A0A2M8W3R0_9MICO|nr:WYL domain-containing protein [Luteimicrobium subarcticum]PJI85558.1 proteasome accessory factor C [Luteimicrobium subarcticum]